MHLEDQVTSIELSKELKRLGVEQDSLFYYAGNTLIYEKEFEFLLSKISNKYSAFTASELLELLPAIVNGSNLELLKGIDITLENPLIYAVRYPIGDLFSNDFCDTNPVNALAKMLIHLIENRFIKND